MHPTRIVILIAAACLVGPSGATAREDPPADPINDCGINSLYLALCLSGRPVDLSRLRQMLPAPPDAGFSMAELQAAAGRQGLRLEGRRLGPADFPLDRPAIALLRHDAGGHFVALRPVGTTGTMVLLLDFPSPPRVIDAARLTSSPNWTGQVLLPRRWWERLAPPALVTGLALASVGLAGRMLAHRRRARLIPSIERNANTLADDETRFRMPFEENRSQRRKSE